MLPQRLRRFPCSWRCKNRRIQRIASSVRVWRPKLSRSRFCLTPLTRRDAKRLQVSPARSPSPCQWMRSCLTFTGTLLKKCGNKKESTMGLTASIFTSWMSWALKDAQIESLRSSLHRVPGLVVRGVCRWGGSAPRQKWLNSTVWITTDCVCRHFRMSRKDRNQTVSLSSLQDFQYLACRSVYKVDCFNQFYCKGSCNTFSCSRTYSYHKGCFECSTDFCLCLQNARSCLVSTIKESAFYDIKLL